MHHLQTPTLLMSWFTNMFARHCISSPLSNSSSVRITRNLCSLWWKIWWSTVSRMTQRLPSQHTSVCYLIICNCSYWSKTCTPCTSTSLPLGECDHKSQECRGKPSWGFTEDKVRKKSCCATSSTWLMWAAQTCLLIRSQVHVHSLGAPALCYAKTMCPRPHLWLT